ncbi:LysR family transcriptional regulator [Altericroceibacterium spongiae]|uniref:LysR family transcriptional regulator n=1 Tax=Altericroceibacterium spongiae TaxID=2320269 RepID=A0A420EE75_9SPHN|nr:LysR family transcriptional regulator [Altericroceibacterium spongiae]RKF18942.1 LysR family transcriptional regulator [Altericroceibacterium spongiae]
MRLRHVEVFHAVYVHGSISAAARALNVSQPSVSKVLRHAEDQLGYPLFLRVKGRLVATEAAHELFTDAAEVYSRMGTLSRTARNISARKGGHLRLAVLPSLGLSVAPRAIAAFRKIEPNMSFEITTLHSKDVARALYERECDLTIGYSGAALPRLTPITFGTGELQIVAPRGRFGSETSLPVTALDGIDFIGLRDSGPSGDLLDAEFTRHGIAPHEVVTARTYYIALALVKEGVGVAVVDEFTARFFRGEDVQIYSLANPIRFPVTGMMLEDSGPASQVRRFIATFRKVLDEESGALHPSLAASRFTGQEMA